MKYNEYTDGTKSAISQMKNKMLEITEMLEMSKDCNLEIPYDSVITHMLTVYIQGVTDTMRYNRGTDSTYTNPYEVMDYFKCEGPAL